MATLESIQPYVEQLFDDSEVQRQLARARANLRGAQARAGKAKSSKKALKDEHLRYRLLEAARATAAAAAAIKAGPEKQRRRSRRKTQSPPPLRPASTTAASAASCSQRAIASRRARPEGATSARPVVTAWANTRPSAGGATSSSAMATRASR